MPPMPDTTELTLFGIAAAVMLVLLASWPIQWWLARRSALADDDEQLDALAESPTLMEAVRSRPGPDPRSCTEVWRDEEGCYRPGPHGCALIGGHRIHRCVCGAVIEDPPLAPTFDPDDVHGLPEDRPQRHPSHNQYCLDDWEMYHGDGPRGMGTKGDGCVCDQAPEGYAIAPPGRPYTTDGVVQLGRNSLCRACVDHRTNGRYADICDACRPSLVGSASKLPPS